MEDKFSFEVRGPSENDGAVSLPPVQVEASSDSGEYSFSPRPPSPEDTAPPPPRQGMTIEDRERQAVASGFGGLLGYGLHAEKRLGARYAAERARDLEAMRKMAEQSAREAEIARTGQTPFERAIQGAREDLTGTTGRARQQTYTTETSRQAQVRRGIDNPFTRGTWGATDQGVLAPPEAIEAERIRQENAARAAARRNMLGTAGQKAMKSVVPILDWMARSRLMGALGGISTGYQGYDAYKAAQEGRYRDALRSGLSAAGGALSMYPTPITIGSGLALSFAPHLIDALLGEEAPPPTSSGLPRTQQ